LENGVASIRAAFAVVCCLASIPAARAEQVQAVPLIVDADSRHCGSFPGSPSRVSGQATWRSIVPIDVP
jgi:hypothetical protein